MADELRTGLENAREKYKKLARRNYAFAYVLVVATIVSSVTAGIAGLASYLRPLPLGILALTPAACSLIASVLKPQGRANWHYAKAARLRGLYRRVAYEGADPAKISAEWTALDAEMDKQWEDNLGLDPSLVSRAALQIPKTTS